MELETDLRNVSDRVLSTLDQLIALETEKRTLQPGTPRFTRLANEVERLAAAVFAQTHTQRNLGERAEVLTQRTGADLAPIDETEAARELRVVLSEWRDAERRLASAAPDSAEHAAAAADVVRLRQEYNRTYAAETPESQPHS